MSMDFWTAAGVMVLCFAVLGKCADWMVEGAVDLARRLQVPAILIGIVIVSIGTTAPELAVSVQAAASGKSELALGNAVGSVIYDDVLALPLVALLSPVVVLIDKAVFRAAAVFLICVDVVAYALCFDGTLSRWEGLLLVAGFCGYLVFTYVQRRRNPSQDDVPEGVPERSLLRILLLFAVGLGGVVVSSEYIVESAEVVALGLGVSETVVALGLIALGTSVPEIATCVASALKKQGSVAVGNILGADILNICWIAGASATVNDLKVEKEVIHFMFPAMLVVVFTMLGLMRIGYRFDRWKGVVLLGLFVAYVLLLVLKSPA